MSIKSYLRRLCIDIDNGISSRNRVIKWEKAHGKGTAGLNGFGEDFWLYDLAPAYPPERRWRLTASPRCPDGGRFCSMHDEEPYWGPDYDEAKRAGQNWSNRRHPIEELP